MKEMPSPQTESADRTQKPMTRELFDRLAKQKIAYSLELFGSPERCVKEFIRGNDDIFKATGQAEVIRNALRQCEQQTKKGAFVEALFQAMKPMYDHLFAGLEEKPGFADKNRVLVNEMLNFDIEGSELRIHVFTGGLDGKLTRYVEGLREVAAVVQGNEEIKTIEVNSWIVAKHPKILERLGFIVEKDENGVPKKQVIKGEDVGHASMPREDFLEKYLNT